MSQAQTWLGRPTYHAAQQTGVDLVSRRRLRGVAPTIDRLDPHALHQRCDMPPADLDAFAGEKIAQHARPRERALQMPFVDPPHERQVAGRNRTRLIGDRAAADAHSLRLAGNRQVVLAVDRRFALNRPALPSAPDKKSFSSASSPILA